MVRVYANFAGLSKKLVRVGISRSVVDLAAFASGFTRSQPLFDFVDAGSDKEGADYKIRGKRFSKECSHSHIDSGRVELFNLLVGSAQCKHILFGGCHDMGYISLLTPYKGIASRITLLETGAVTGSFPALGFRKIDFASVFRFEVLPCEKKTKNSRVPNGTDDSQTLVGHDSLSPSVAHTLPWDSKRTILLNQNDQRIDTVLPQPAEGAQKAYDRYVSQRKLCNDHHLLGGCVVPRCIYDHGPVGREMLLVIRHQLRYRACGRGSACRSFDCYYGHNCPRPGCIGGKKCKFKLMHNLDLNPVKELVQ